MFLSSKNKPIRRYVRTLPTEKIHIPSQIPEAGTLLSLAESIKRWGVLEPIIVRRDKHVYELVAGKKRLVAARLAGLETISCIVMRCDDESSEALSIVENIQRFEPDFYDTAIALRRLITRNGLPIETAAALVGMSCEDAISKLRVLRLPRRFLMALRDAGLTQRHALALLRINDDDRRDAALCEMAYKGLNDRAADDYVDELIAHDKTSAPKSRSVYVVRDVRFFLNSIDHGLKLMRESGIDASLDRLDNKDNIVLKVTIPRETAIA